MPINNLPLNVGEALSRKRTERGLSLQALAKVSGVSKSMISQVENGQVNPTLAVIWKLATGLGIRLQDLLENEVERPETRFTLLTEANCPTLTSKEHGYRIQILSTIDMVEQLELYLVEFEPNGAMASEAHEKGTMETLTVIRGDVEIDLPDGFKRRLKTLESCRYAADVPHTVRSAGARPALAYLAVRFEH